MATSSSPPRIFRVRYRSANVRRVADFHVKVPYGGTYGLTEALTRQLTTGQVLWFRIDVAKVITPEIRSSLQRWTEAIDHTTQITEVDWTR